MTRGTRWERIWADLAKFSILQQNHILYSIPFEWRCLILSLASSTFYDGICLNERYDQFEHSNYSKKNTVMKDVFSFMHIDKRLCIIFSWNSPDYGRPKTVENKGSNVLHDRINITFSDWVIVKNIISGNVIINRGRRVARRRPGSMGFNIIWELT